MKKEFSEKIKYIGFVMTCFIVAYHWPKMNDGLFVNAIDSFTKRFVDYAVYSVANVGLCWFFAITGFLLFQNYSLEKYPGKIKKRVFSLFIPYLIWQIIALLVDIIPGQFTFSLGGFLRGVFLFDWPHNIPLWYIYEVFLLAVLSPALYCMIKRKNLGWFLILVVIFSLKLLVRSEAPAVEKAVRYGYVHSIIYYLPAYLAGAFFGFHYKDGKTDGLYYLLVAFIVTLVFDDWLTGLFAETVVKLMPIAMLYLLPPINIPERIQKKKYAQIYKISFLTYLIHGPIVADLHAGLQSGCLRMFSTFTKYMAPAIVFIYLIQLLLCLAIAAILYWALSKKAPRLLALLTGGRS